MNKLKDQICTETINRLNSNKLENADMIADNLCEKLLELASQFTCVMDVEITETEEQIDAIIDEMEKGKENVQQRELALDETETRLKKLNSRLDDLIKRIMES